MMSRERFAELAAAYGGDPKQWPDSERPDALAWLMRNPAARGELDQARALDALLAAAPLDIAPAASAAAAAMAARIVAAHPRPLTTPRARRSFGWPNVAALAAAALAGFIVGWADLGSGAVLAADNESDLQELFTPASVIEDGASLVEDNL